MRGTRARAGGTKGLFCILLLCCALAPKPTLQQTPTCAWNHYYTQTGYQEETQDPIYTCSECTPCPGGNYQSGGCQDAANTVCSNCSNALPDKAKWRTTTLTPGRYLSENVPSVCSYDCQIHYRADANQTKCYKFGILQLGAPKVEFELTYDLPASALTYFVSNLYHASHLMHVLGGMHPWHAAVCDSEGCWASAGYDPEQHGDLPLDTRRLLEPEPEPPGGGRRGVGYGIRQIESANLTLAGLLYDAQREGYGGEAPAGEAPLKYLRSPQRSFVTTSVQVKDAAEGQRVIDKLLGTTFLPNMTTYGCTVINQTLAELEGVYGSSSNQNCSQRTPTITSQPRLITAAAACYGCVDKSIANASLPSTTIPSQCRSCCELRCMESFVISDADAALTDGWVDISTNGNTMLTNLTSFNTRMALQHRQCIADCEVECRQECSPKPDEEEPYPVPEEVVERARGAAVAVTAFVAIAIAAGVANSVAGGVFSS
eukprot:CAMPEP_0172053094 /NCGR_PEP_ID=MMETSP1043-20130122/4025_1 /TAXON_ID=464988 /ORGANISM="Hemiselmis andersenii, Strain CCMP441" /LENGTH=486 /DNA_ID=CAMNT_0012712325 /DNA_START=91 /DNA_END=1547 /DNA_ORIENTATION=-